MFSTREMTTSQVSETTILTNAMTLTRSALLGNSCDSALEIGWYQAGVVVRPLAMEAARMLRMQMPMIRTTASTK